MISIQFSGRLGNLLFQIAATIAYAMELEHAFEFESASLLAWKNSIFRELSPFIVDTYETTTIPYNETDTTKLLIERPSPEERTQLVGFFQDYRIFDKWRSTILGITGISRRRQEVLSSQKFDLGSVENKPTISIHIRRGDYADAKCYHLLLNEYYYKNAVLNILSRSGSESGVRFIVFCEPNAQKDAEKIVDKLKSTTDVLGYQAEYVFFKKKCSNPLEDWEELMAMSGCNHHIIANSTFSWWSAYLNPSHNKIVCYPDQWYNHQLYYLSTEGLEMPGWTKIAAWNPAEYKCVCYEMIANGQMVV